MRPTVTTVTIRIAVKNREMPVMTFRILFMCKNRASRRNTATITAQTISEITVSL